MDIGRTIAEMMAERINEAERLRAEMKTAADPKTRQDIHSRIIFNDYILHFLARLVTGRIGEVPEKLTAYEIRG